MICKKCCQKVERKGYYIKCKCGKFRLKKDGTQEKVKEHPMSQEYLTPDEYEELVG